MRRCAGRFAVPLCRSCLSARSPYPLLSFVFVCSRHVELCIVMRQTPTRCTALVEREKPMGQARRLMLTSLR